MPVEIKVAASGCVDGDSIQDETLIDRLSILLRSDPKAMDSYRGGTIPS